MVPQRQIQKLKNRLDGGFCPSCLLAKTSNIPQNSACDHLQDVIIQHIHTIVKNTPFKNIYGTYTYISGDLNILMRINFRLCFNLCYWSLMLNY